MNIILYQPELVVSDSPMIPLGLLYLASALEREGHRIKVYDAQIDEVSFREVSDVVDLLMVSCMGGETIWKCLDAVSEFKSSHPTKPVLWGGALITMLGKKALDDPHVDLIVRGHGEKEVCRICKDVLSEASAQQEAADLPIIWEPLRVDLFPLPYHLLAMDAYPKDMPVHMLTSRGCFGGCRFCYLKQWPNKCYSSLPAKVVCDEIQRLNEMYGFDKFCFVDDDFFHNESRLYEICINLLKRPLAIKWEASARADRVCSLGEKTFKVVVESGCSVLHMGGESGSDHELRLMGKGQSRGHLIRALDRCKEVGVDNRLNFILGYPGSSKEDFRETEKFLHYLDQNYGPQLGNFRRLSVFAPWPGTPACKVAVKLGNDIPGSLLEWADYRLFDAEELDYLTKENKLLIKDIFNSDYYTRVIKPILSENGDINVNDCT